ncbi:Protein of unknown function [Catalinimonas alkaloidigena]|uniref:DUF4199 domain-containing protein n=1 Tax=Catalinimonas alkaloidigena TaxID=1075417 RepID=A0A1G9USA1_9BACT|nr:DUF4199 domain-containing protein [Catalinimonas alkaloidigena]SDM62764.1 Protein of unknown function [Catalinimonas alkaloidigena]
MSTSATPTPIQTGLRYGLIVGIIMAIYSVVLQLTSLAQNTALGLISWAILIGGIFWAVRDYRTQHGGFMSFGEGTKTGVMVSVIAGLFTSVFSYVYFKFIDPTALEKIRDLQITQMEDRGMSDAEIEQAMSFAGVFTSPGGIAIMGILMMVIFGLIIALIVSAIMKKERPFFS